MDNNNAQWYVLQVLTGYEKMVQTNLLQMVENSNLHDFIFDVVVPEEEDIVEDKNGKRKVIMRKKFPTYVFIKMIYTKQVWYLVTRTRGVTSFCGPQGRPLPLTPEEVKRNQLEKIDISDLKIAVGDQVSIISGALNGFIGEVKDINIETEKVKVSVSMFGRETPVELEFGQVEKI